MVVMLRCHTLLHTEEPMLCTHDVPYLTDLLTLYASVGTYINIDILLLTRRQGATGMSRNVMAVQASERTKSLVIGNSYDFRTTTPEQLV